MNDGGDWVESLVWAIGVPCWIIILYGLAWLVLS